MRYFFEYSFLAVTLIMAHGVLNEAAAQTFAGSLEKRSVTRGENATGRIVMTIPDGLHVNSNRPSNEYAIATVIRASAAPAKIVAIQYPRGRDRKFQFSDDPINVYEGRVTFRFTVRVPKNFRGNLLRVRASIRYQPCTDEVCYPPRSTAVTMTAPVR